MLRYLDLLQEDPAAFFVLVAAFGLAFVTGIAFHEFSHAWTANELGDDTAARQGRVTLNPLAHLDPVGTALLLIVGVGWGKPTPVNPYRLRHGPLRGNMLVAAAGPISNFAFATVAALPLVLGWVEPVPDLDRIEDATGGQIFGTFLFFIAWINVILGVFNLIPIHPLDGFKVVLGILPTELAKPLASAGNWMPALLLGLVALSFIAPQYSPLSWIFGGAADVFLDIVR